MTHVVVTIRDAKDEPLEVLRRISAGFDRLKALAKQFDNGGLEYMQFEMEIDDLLKTCGTMKNVLTPPPPPAEEPGPVQQDWVNDLNKAGS